MLPRPPLMNLENLLTSRRASLVAWSMLVVLCVLSFVIGGCASRTAAGEPDAAALAASLARACPMGSPGDVAAQEACRSRLGKGADGAMRDYSFLWGGDAPGVPMKEKSTTIFRGDLFQDLYLSLYMFTGKYTV